MRPAAHHPSSTGCRSPSRGGMACGVSTAPAQAFHKLTHFTRPWLMPRRPQGARRPCPPWQNPAQGIQLVPSECPWVDKCQHMHVPNCSGSPGPAAPAPGPKPWPLLDALFPLGSHSTDRHVLPSGLCLCCDPPGGHLLQGALLDAPWDSSPEVGGPTSSLPTRGCRHQTQLPSPCTQHRPARPCGEPTGVEGLDEKLLLE